MQRKDAIFRLLFATGLYLRQACIRDTTVCMCVCVRACVRACVCMYVCRDEFIRYRIAVCDAKSKFCDAKLNVIRRKLRCEAILTAPKKCCLYAISVRT